MQLTANQTVGNYWIRATPNNNEATDFANGINSAILRYKGAPEQEPDSTQTPSLQSLVETDLQPLTNPAAVSTSLGRLLGPSRLTRSFPISLESPTVVGLITLFTSPLVSTLYVRCIRDVFEAS